MQKRLYASEDNEWFHLLVQACDMGIEHLECIHTLISPQVYSTQLSQRKFSHAERVVQHLIKMTIILSIYELNAILINEQNNHKKQVHGNERIARL